MNNGGGTAISKRTIIEMEDFQITVLTDVIAPDQNVTKRNLLYEFGQSSGNSSKTGAFILQITDPNDPIFLYDYQLNPQDYPALKEELNLFGEYPGFSQSVYDLLTRCVQQEDHIAVIDQHKYNTPMLLLQQKTQMALLTPFKVPLIAASPTRLNQFLSSEVNKYKSLFFDKEKNCEEVEAEVESLNEKIEEMQTNFQMKFQEQADQYKESTKNLTEQYETQISELKNKFKTSSQNALSDRQKSETEITNKYEATINDLRQQIKQINDDKTQEMLQKVSNEEKIKSLETQLNAMTAAKTQLESEKNAMTQQLTQVSSSSTEYMTKVESLNNTINILKAAAEQNKLLISANNKQIDKLQEEITKKDNEIASLTDKSSENEKKVQEHDWIIAKSKQVIEKFLAEAKERKQEIRDLRSEVEEKEEDIKQCQIKAASDYATIESQKENIDRVCKENQLLSQKITELEENIKELQLKISSDESTISMLNKRLNTYEINGEGGNIGVDDELLNSFTLTTPSSTSKKASNAHDIPVFKSSENEPDNIWETTFF